VLGEISSGRHRWLSSFFKQETSAFNIQTPGKFPEESISYLQHGESLKSTKLKLAC
jgi:hypothetical protein